MLRNCLNNLNQDLWVYIDIPISNCKLSLNKNEKSSGKNLISQNIDDMQIDEDDFVEFDSIVKSNPKKRIIIDDDEPDEGKFNTSKERAISANDDNETPQISSPIIKPCIQIMLSFLDYLSTYDCSSPFFNCLSISKYIKDLDHPAPTMDFMLIRQSIIEGLYGKDHDDINFSAFVDDIRSVLEDFKKISKSKSDDIFHHSIFLSNIFELEINSCVQNCNFKINIPKSKEIYHENFCSDQLKYYLDENFHSNGVSQSIVASLNAEKATNDELILMENMSMFYETLSESDLLNCIGLELIEYVECNLNQDSKPFTPKENSYDFFQPDPSINSYSNKSDSISDHNEIEIVNYVNNIVQLDFYQRKLAETILHSNIRRLVINKMPILYDRNRSKYVSIWDDLKLKNHPELKLYVSHLTKYNNFYFFHSRMRTSLLGNSINSLTNDFPDYVKLSKSHTLLSQKCNLFSLLNSMSCDFSPYLLKIIEFEKLFLGSVSVVSIKRSTRNSLNCVEPTFRHLNGTFDISTNYIFEFLYEFFSYPIPTTTR